MVAEGEEEAKRTATNTATTTANSRRSAASSSSPTSKRAAFEDAASGAMLEPCRAAHGEPPRGDEGEGATEKKREWKSWAAAGWLPENPLRVPTEREVHTLSQGLPVYRCLLVKKT